MKKSWLYYLILLLLAEKLIQHIFVTLAFYFDWAGIRSTVAVSPDALMISGAFIALLFALALWGLFTARPWSLTLAAALAVVDLIGEFIAQGKVMIQLNVSFLVAALLLILIFAYRSRRQLSLA